MSSPFTTLVGPGGMVLLPLLLADSNSPPTLAVGPNYDRHNIRLYAKTPKRSDSERLPCPPGYDRTTVTYDIQYLVVTGPVPPTATVEFYAINSSQGKGKITKTPIHKWDTHQPTGVRPAMSLTLKMLNPGNWVSISGMSKFYRPGYRQTRPKGGVPFLDYAPAKTPPPTIKHFVPLSVALFAQLKWLPLQPRNAGIEFVSGHPLDMVSTPVSVPLDPIAPMEDGSPPFSSPFPRKTL